ncbi:Hypothetical predicted protein [Mytilus galloprovincialis]|uniref:Ig-like domain-containing protein n=1 Tax=Mytilus galloprovincialis TaxID=29158 RepID=A0A8B6FUC8_MYTGA|nr:Hypothetical predicted protein [Mytilus galloprovincialis]
MVHVCAAFPLKCPEPAQWSLRARSHCPDPSKYFCLKNDLINGYSENCTVFDFLQPGRKHVLRGGLDADPCSSERFQPWPITFYTNVSTDCIFLKSICNEEGQVIYDHGNRNTDITCRCDYTRGYDFIVKPRNPCFCIPSEEDCSCHLKMCQDSRYVLSPGYGCIHSNKNTSINLCKPIFYERINRESNQSDFEEILRVRNISTAENYLTTVAILVTCISLAVLFLSYPLAKFLANCYIEHNFFSKALSIEPAEEVIEGNDISISCEIIQKNMGGTWYKNKSPLISTTRLASDINEKKHTLKIRNAELSDSAVYCIDFNGVKREIQLQVEGFFSKELSIDPEEVIEGKDVSISCEIIQKDMGGTWYKNGSPLSSTDRIECGINEKLNILTIHNAELSDSAVYSIDFKGVKRQTQLHVEDLKLVEDRKPYLNRL